MRTITAIILAIILLAASIGTSSVFAQDGGDDGYPVDGYPVVTEPTPDPTNPPPDPPAPTPAPPQATPEPTSNPTEPRPVLTDAPPVSTQAPDEPSLVCEGLRSHPIITQIAERSHVAYEELMIYFCQYDLDVGEIVLLVNTISRSESDVSLEEVLAMRVEDGLGWEEIWQLLGYQGTGEGEGEGENSDQPEVFSRNETRDKFNHQESNSDD